MIVKREQLVRISTADTIVSVQTATELIPVAIVAVSMILKYRFSLILFLKILAMVNQYVPRDFGALATAVLILTNVATLILMIVKMELHAIITMVDIAASAPMALRQIQMATVLTRAMKKLNSQKL